MTRPPPLADPVRLELFTNRFSAIARDMGEVLRRSALSTNVKERLDFSCALLDPEGSLVVNAPHIPVHLGALGLCVRRVAAAVEMAPGDVVVTNHPGYGGSHLPDVTVITPVFAEDAVEAAGGAPRLLGYAASRAHHAEIGGSRPGSMPPDATRLVDEGVVLPPIHLIRGGEPRWDELRRRLEAPPWPSRAPEENLADLAAAVAANRRGAEALARLAAAAGADVVAAAMAGLEARAETLLRRALARLAAERPGRMEAEDRLDDGSPLRVAVELLAAGPGSGTESGAAAELLAGGEGGPAVRIDFTGSAPVHPGNLNATPAIVRSVVLYVLRLLVGEPLPLNEGLARPVELIVPEGMLSPPFPDDPARCPAVVGGNVETSQRLVDVLLAALGLAAGSQGTMNNVLFGGAGFAYYETVAGGCGAGPGFAGASAVHSHMTNTRATDPEVLERRYPVRLERFAVRRGSGGAGRWPGGDGVVRETVFLAPLTLSLLTQHRTTAPRGAAGGHPGAPGRQRLLRASGQTEDLPPIAGREVSPGDRLILETPGGGGWGAPDDADHRHPPPDHEEPPDAERGRRHDAAEMVSKSGIDSATTAVGVFLSPLPPSAGGSGRATPERGRRRVVPGVVEECPTQPSGTDSPAVFSSIPQPSAGGSGSSISERGRRRPLPRVVEEHPSQPCGAVSTALAVFSSSPPPSAGGSGSSIPERGRRRVVPGVVEECPTQPSGTDSPAVFSSIPQPSAGGSGSSISERGRRRPLPRVVEEHPSQPSAWRSPVVRGAPRPGAPPSTSHERAPCPGQGPPPPPRAFPPPPPPPLPEPPP